MITKKFNLRYINSVNRILRLKISKFTGRSGVVVQNGIDKFYDFPKQDNGVIQSQNKEFTCIYVGTLYPFQNIEIYLQTIFDLLNEGCLITTKFYGIEVIPEQLEIMRERTKMHKSFFEFHNRVSRHDLQLAIQQSTVCLLFSYYADSEVLPLKIFDYISNRKPLILSAADNGIVHDFITYHQAGFTFNSVEEGKKIMRKLVNENSIGSTEWSYSNEQDFLIYTRKYQNKILSDLILSYI